VPPGAAVPMLPERFLSGAVPNVLRACPLASFFLVLQVYPVEPNFAQVPAGPVAEQVAYDV
jgi:hypothetical protein